MNKQPSYSSRLKAVVDDALKAIDTYSGPKAVTLATGEKALDMDDAWLLIGKGKPVLRNKKDQHLIEHGEAQNWEDEPFGGSDYSFPLDVCAFADRLYGSL